MIIRPFGNLGNGYIIKTKDKKGRNSKWPTFSNFKTCDLQLLSKGGNNIII